MKLNVVQSDSQTCDSQTCDSQTCDSQTSIFTTFLVAVRSKASVCALLIAGITGSNPVEGMDVSVSCVCCVLCRQWPLSRADRLFRGVLPGVCVFVRMCLIACDRGTSATGRPSPTRACYFTVTSHDVQCQ
jgi:hypothetical protein